MIPHSNIVLWGLEKSAAFNFANGMQNVKGLAASIYPHAHASTDATLRWLQQAPGFMHGATPGTLAAEIGAMTAAKAFGPKLMGLFRKSPAA